MKCAEMATIMAKTNVMMETLRVEMGAAVRAPLRTSMSALADRLKDQTRAAMFGTQSQKLNSSIRTTGFLSNFLKKFTSTGKSIRQV